MSEKISVFGSINQAIRNLEEAVKNYELLYDTSQVRLPKEDVETIAESMSKAHKLLEKISLVNGEFRKIANN